MEVLNSKVVAILQAVDRMVPTCNVELVNERAQTEGCIMRASLCSKATRPSNNVD